MLVAPSPPPMTVAHHVTHDPYLASFLLSEGAVLLRSRRIGPKTVEFSFVPNARLHKLLRFYWSNSAAPLVPSRLFASLARLKKRSLIES
jgi:hypothetical protein